MRALFFFWGGVRAVNGRGEEIDGEGEEPDEEDIVSKKIAEREGAERDERGDHQGHGWRKEGEGGWAALTNR